MFFLCNVTLVHAIQLTKFVTFILTFIEDFFDAMH